MAIKLPKAIAAYFTADKRGNAVEVSECFVETAFVKDEGQTYLGRDEIRDWKNKSSKKYDYTVEPFEITTEGRRTVVSSHVIGNFPGSPVELRYSFVLDSDLIEELEITLSSHER
nr:nuclear transport factor 2 family protein [Rhizobium sp. Q54]